MEPPRLLILKANNMAKNEKTKPPTTSSAPTPLELVPDIGESNRETVARKFTGPFIGHSLVVEQLLSGIVKGLPDADRPGLVEYGKALLQRAEDAKDGDLALASHLLMMQAISLDKIFAEYARLSVVNKIEYLDASERFMRLALKAQSNSRATLDTLNRVSNKRITGPRFQIVWCKRELGKVSQIFSYDCLCLSFQGCSQDVFIIKIG